MNNDYMSDEDLLKFISEVEEDLVAAPPEMKEKVFDRIDKKSQILEYKRFRNRVVAAVAAIVISVSFMPEIGDVITKNVPQTLTVVQSNRSTSDTYYISNFLNGRRN